ncbi:MAG: formyltetrahydrofolate deformylase [Hyphomonadaceae bacterium]|jgi:formyltetrahydrofolate deformylase|nr:formyltetrahydrofolate deformylase [Hyphomonadaceae bacterium]
MPERSTAILTFSCPDRIGIVHAVAAFLKQNNCNIADSAQFSDETSGQFFMRVVFTGVSVEGLARLREQFGLEAETLSLDWQIHHGSEKTRTMILVSKFDHCLRDLLYRHSMGELPIEIVGIVSNHRDCEALAANHAVPFHHHPVSAATKAAQEEHLLHLIETTGTELVVLARYMQILSDDFTTRLAGRVINIHHSFLPSFKGARPYQQAHARGVKLIGATAHFASPELDEGPIIDQGVVPVNHAYSAGEFIALGRDVERIVLARAVKAFAERRILLNGTKTVVFSK